MDRYIVVGGILNGYSVIDTRKTKLARSYATNLGMWEAINLRDKLSLHFS